ncbi:threonylcarbamoyl-AMP synthase [Camelimonas fluminis]|uniref:Threonylcarbamoyl-AMP synthase n=1 Tax=Camelimonas fluminis TaxID=1576911 RepID=A0ABV7UDP5_9HYPH|nr:L-threonylcarbamoyladenylate synthase [Camelimonas fluminis]GHE47663.1 threonylcarbamoyl-AMP synthase [Camelimonas fluminis]
MTRRTLRLDASADGLATAAQLLRDGGLVAFPTETVYGLGGDATNGRAVAGIYAAKGRPSFNPLISHVPDLAAARAFGAFDAVALRLAERFWPGPLTLVVPAVAGSGVSDLAVAGLPTIALRVPATSAARELLRQVGRPVTAPSANASGHVSPTTAAHVLADLDGRIDAVVDGGPTQVGVESTVVAVVDGVATLLRPGGVTRSTLEAVLGGKLVENADADPARPASPGMLASHYAPNAQVRLNVDEVRVGEALLTFGGARPPGSEHAVMTLDLSESGDLAEAAAGLFGALRRLDAAGVTAIATTPVPDRDLGEAINDRLRRAAAPK